MVHPAPEGGHFKWSSNSNFPFFRVAMINATMRDIVISNNNHFPSLGQEVSRTLSDGIMKLCFE